MSIAGYLAQCDRMVRDGYFYDNGVPSRCYPDPYKGRDCSTFSAFALIDAGYQDVNPCSTSWTFLDECKSTVRPDWFIERFGPGEGTVISYQQAQTVICWGFETTGGGHIETILGKPGGSKDSVGAHSHASGLGYSVDGIDHHNLDTFAVPVYFLHEMAPAKWKVQPMFNPALEVAAALQSPQGGWWIAMKDAHVVFLAPNGQIYTGGLTGQYERQQWESAPREVAHLEHRWYKPKGALRRKAGYVLVATDNNKYVPAAQA